MIKNARAFKNHIRLSGLPALAALATLTIVVAMLLLTSSCGYKLAAEEPSVIGSSSKTLKIKRIENPTLYPWLSHLIHTITHDEVNFRNLATWVDSGEADYEMEIKIDKFKIEDRGYSREGTGVMFNAEMTMSIILYDGSTNKQVWNSGNVSLSRVYDSDNNQLASSELASALIRRCLDRMRFVF